MKTDVKTLYPGHDDEDYFSICGYQPMTDSFGKVLVQVDDRDYQGDTRVLLEGVDGRPGLLIFGWGSCSGCDALQACENYNDLQQLYDRLKSCIRWFDDADDALCYFETHDWKGDYSWHEKEMRVFISQCKDALAKMVAAKHNDTCPSLDGDGKSCTCTKNPMDCGKRDFCHEPGGCCCSDADRFTDDDDYFIGLGDDPDDLEHCPPLTDAEYAEMQKRDYLEGRIGLEDGEDTPKPGLDAERWYDQKITEAEAEYAEIDALVKAAGLFTNEKKVDRTDPKWEDALRAAAICDPRPLKMFVWEGVLRDYTDGMVVAVAHDLEEALRIVRRTSEQAYNEVKDLEPLVVDSPSAFVAYGGG